MRIEDAWYDSFLKECRVGDLSEEMYNFLMGFPTQHAGTWMPSRTNEAPRILCGTATCQTLHVRWTAMAAAGAAWQDMVCQECEACRTERARRNRLMEADDPRVHKEPFLRAPYVHQNNTPKYHAMLLRAVEEAKRGTDDAKHILWVRAQDRPHSPKQIASTPARGFMCRRSHATRR